MRNRAKRHGQNVRRRESKRQTANDRDTLRFYKSVVGIMVKRCEGTLIVTGKEFAELKGSLAWRKTEDGGVEFQFVQAEEPEP